MKRMSRGRTEDGRIILRFKWICDDPQYTEAEQLLCRLFNELSDPHGIEWGNDPRDVGIIHECTRLIKEYFREGMREE